MMYLKYIMVKQIVNICDGGQVENKCSFVK